jgi:hypothetical protein
MLRMAYYEAYWTAVAAAAPVIALANTVALDAKRLNNRLVHYLTKARMRDGHVIRSFFWALLRAGWPVSASIYNYLIQILALMFALISLQNRQNFVSVYVTTVALLLGLAIVALASLRFYLDEFKARLWAALGISETDERGEDGERATAQSPT